MELVYMDGRKEPYTLSSRMCRGATSHRYTYNQKKS